MRALTGGHVFHDLSSEDLVVRYIASSIIRSPDGRYFLSKLEVLSDPLLLFELSARLADRLRDDIAAICALASSGMAVGVCTALVARLPLTFFHRAGFPRPESHGLGSRFRPDRPIDAKVALVDSHEYSRYTSALCHDELEEYNSINVAQALVPYSFDAFVDPNNSRDDVTYTSLRRFSDAINEVAQLKGDFTPAELTSYIDKPLSSFWMYPPYDRVPESYLEFSVPGIGRRPQWFLGRGTDLSIVRRVSPELEKLCSWINPSDEGIWEFFFQPSFVREFAMIAGSVLNIEDFDHLVGVGHLGTATAIALAYYNQDRFKGTIISCLGEYGLIPRPVTLQGAKVLLLEMRVQTGVYAVDVYERLSRLGAQVPKYVSIFRPSEPRGLIEQSRQTSIGRLVASGVSIISLA